MTRLGELTYSLTNYRGQLLLTTPNKPPIIRATHPTTTSTYYLTPALILAIWAICVYQSNRLFMIFYLHPQIRYDLYMTSTYVALSSEIGSTRKTEYGI